LEIVKFELDNSARFLRRGFTEY